MSAVGHSRKQLVVHLSVGTRRRITSWRRLRSPRSEQIRHPIIAVPRVPSSPDMRHRGDQLRHTRGAFEPGGRAVETTRHRWVCSGFDEGVMPVDEDRRRAVHSEGVGRGVVGDHPLGDRGAAHASESGCLDDSCHGDRMVRAAWHREHFDSHEINSTARSRRRGFMTKR